MVSGSTTTDEYAYEGLRAGASGRVLSKPQLRDRVQAVVYAYEHGLMRPGSNLP